MIFSMRSLVWLLVGCSSNAVEPVATSTPVPVQPERASVPPPKPPPPPPVASPTPAPAVFGREVRSVRFPTTTTLRTAPDADITLERSRVGVVHGGTRVGVLGEAPASHGCRPRWILVAPRGWVCESAIVASTEEPTTATAVALTDPDEGVRVVRGVYGTVRGANVQAFASESDAIAGTGRTLSGSHSVRAAGRVTIDGRRFWRTTQGELIDESAIAMFGPSKFKGVVIGADAAMPAWARSRHDHRKPVTSYDADGKVNGRVPARAIIEILEVSNQFVRIDEDRWLAAKDVRIASLSPPPPNLGPDEKWFDIELDQQVLVAYEGTRPVYATMVSTGKFGHYTPTVVSRIFAKHETAHMNSEASEAKAYSVADVPWTMFYEGNYALHTSYWHDSFGDPQSHGCINLAPRDARLLYRWSSPDVPPGWSSVYGDASSPGSIVRVRSSRNPAPEVRGYARVVTAER